LEIQPLIHDIAFLGSDGIMEFAILVVSFDKVACDGVGFPQDEIVIVVVDDRRDTGIRVVLGESWVPLFAGNEAKIFGLIRNPEGFEDDGGFLW